MYPNEYICIYFYNFHRKLRFMNQQRALENGIVLKVKIDYPSYRNQFSLMLVAGFGNSFSTAAKILSGRSPCPVKTMVKYGRPFVPIRASDSEVHG